MKTLKQRLLDKVLYHPSRCWIWTGAALPQGYGKLGRGARGEGTLLAHRASYEMFVGPIPQGMFVLHRCDNPRCVNPEHLFLGTQQDNIDDCAAKGRKTTPFFKGHTNHWRWPKVA